MGSYISVTVNAHSMGAQYAVQKLQLTVHCLGLASISVVIISALRRCSLYLTVHCMGEAFISVISEASTFYAVLPSFFRIL